MLTALHGNLLHIFKEFIDETHELEDSEQDELEEDYGDSDEDETDQNR
jgi:hypothetical protein